MYIIMHFFYLTQNIKNASKTVGPLTKKKIEPPNQNTQRRNRFNNFASFVGPAEDIIIFLMV